MNPFASLALLLVGALGFATFARPEPTAPPAAGTEPFIGEIMWVPYNFEPRGWAFCNGQLLEINSHHALFSLLGTTYGGDGRNTFALPDLRGRMPMHAGEGPGLSPRRLGQKGGRETVTLTLSEVPAHTHALHTKAEDGPEGAGIGGLRAADGTFATGAPSGTAEVLSQVGGNQPHDNMPPFAALHAVIALDGVFPPRK